MKVLVLGAAGPTGRLVVEQARAAGHEVTAFVRREGGADFGGARVVVGDATRAGSLDATVPGHDAVVSTLGVRSPPPRGLQECAMRALVPAMERAGTRRLIVMSALGVGDTRQFAPALPRVLYALLLRSIFADKAAGEAIVAASGLDWTIVHPPLLTNAAPSGRYTAAEMPRLSGFPKISRADVAHFMVRTLPSGEWSRRHVVVTG